MARSAPLSSITQLSSLRAVGRFFGWWLGELRDLVPPALQSWWTGQTNIVFCLPDDGQMMFAKRTGGQQNLLLATPMQVADASAPGVQRQLRAVAGKNASYVLCLPATKAFVRLIDLPLVLEENLVQAVGFELDRFTPFRPEHACYDVRLIERDAANKRLAVELVVARKPVVDDYLAQLGAMGVTPSGVSVRDGDGNPIPDINLRRDAVAAPQSAGKTRHRLTLAVLAFLLLALALAVPLWQKRAAATSLLGPLELAKREALAADALRTELETRLDDRNRLPKKKWETPSMVLVLDEVTKLLSDDSYLTHLDVDGRSITLLGDAASAASLVELFESSDGFKEVAFKSPLQKIQGTVFDRFHIVAALDQGVVPRPLPADALPEATPATPPSASPPGVTPPPVTPPAPPVGTPTPAPSPAAPAAVSALPTATPPLPAPAAPKPPLPASGSRIVIGGTPP